MAVCRRMSITEESDGGPAWKGLEKLIALRPSPMEIVTTLVGVFETCSEAKCMPVI